MKKNKNLVGIISAIWIIAIIIFAWYVMFGYRLGRGTIKVEKKLLDISGIDEAYDAVLNKSTNNFIGSHRIDEEFLGWFVDQYGVDTLEGIAAYATLDSNRIWSNVCGKSIHVLWHDFQKEKGIEDRDFQRTLEVSSTSTTQFVMDFTGDFSLAEGVGTTSYFHGVGGDLTRCMSQPLLEELNGADLLVVNNEFTYTNRGTPLAGKDYLFRADPTLVSQLKVMGTDLVGLANNHVYDYGNEGITDTLDTIEGVGLPVIGAGKNIKEASQPMYYISNGRKIAIVAATQIERSTNYTKEATEDSAGVLKTLNSKKYVAAIKKAKKNADIVICFVHWGTEGTHHAGADQKKLATEFVEAGADAIVGGHSHCLQGIDVIQGVPVFYSLGNFYFSQEPEMPDDYDTAVGQLVIDEGGMIRARVLPCHFSNGYLSLIQDGDKYNQILQDIGTYSTGITLDEEGYFLVK